MLSIRSEKPEDVELIYELNKSAFGQANEAKLIDGLRDVGALSYSLVAFDNDELVGHLALSPVTIHQDDQVVTAIGLGPMAIKSTHQRRGIGTKLFNYWLNNFDIEQYGIVFVLARPAKRISSRSPAGEYNAVLIAEDVWLSQLFPEEINVFDDYLKYSSRLKGILAPHIQNLLLKGVSIVLDFPGNTPKQRGWFRSIFESVGANHLLHYLVASNELCKQQLKIRSQGKPEGSAFTTEAEFEAITAYFQPPTPEEDFIIKIYLRN